MLLQNDGRSPSPLSWPDWLMLVAASILLLTFLFIPWVHVDADLIRSAWSLLSDVPPQIRTNVPGIFLIGLGAIIGLLAGILALRSPRNRRAGMALGVVGALICLAYYALFIFRNNNKLGTASGQMGFGFWIAFVAAVALFVQAFLPRPRIADEKSHAGLVFLLPGVVWVLFFTVFPLVQSFGLSFTNLRLGRDASFIGFQNYAEIPTDLRVQETVFTSIFLSVFGVLLTLAFGTAIAWLFNRKIPGLRIFRTIMTIPLFAAPIAVGFLGKVLFNETSGPVNQLLRGVGLSGLSWFTDPAAARLGVLIVDTWQWTPFVFLVVLAAMQSISDDLYEAARLDTSSGWVMFTKITFPLIAPALGTVAMLRLVETFKILDIPLAMTSGGPGTATQTFSYYIYEKGLGRSFDLGYASSLAYVLVIVAIIVTTLYFWRVRERFT